MKLIRATLSMEESKELIYDQLRGGYLPESGTLWGKAARWKVSHEQPEFIPLAGMYMRCIVRESFDTYHMDKTRDLDVVFFDLAPDWKIGDEQLFAFAESSKAYQERVQVQGISFNEFEHEPDWDGPRVESFHEIIRQTKPVSFDDESAMETVTWLAQQYARDFLLHHRRTLKFRIPTEGSQNAEVTFHDSL